MQQTFVGQVRLASQFSSSPFSLAIVGKVPERQCCSQSTDSVNLQSNCRSSISSGPESSYIAEQVRKRIDGMLRTDRVALREKRHKYCRSSFSSNVLQGGPHVDAGTTIYHGHRWLGAAQTVSALET